EIHQKWTQAVLSISCRLYSKDSLEFLSLPFLLETWSYDDIEEVSCRTDSAKESRRDVAKLVTELQNSVRKMHVDQKRAVDYDMVEDPTHSDEMDLDNIGTAADVAFELSDVAYADVAPFSEAEVAAWFETLDSGFTDAAGAAGSRGGGAAASCEDDANSSNDVAQLNAASRLLHVGEKQFLLRAVDFEDRRMQKSALQLFVDNQFHVLNLYYGK
ncbi:unnamed protein product, partial [Amoebophrya sp. A25]